MARSIAFLKSTILKRGGLEKYTLRLADAFAREGHKVLLLTTDYETGQIDAPSFEVVNLGKRFPISYLQLLRFDRQCQQYLHTHPVDIVFGMDRNFCTQTHYRAGNGCHAAYLDRRKMRESWFRKYTFSINPLHRLILQMERETFVNPKLKCLFANSHMVKREILRYYPGADPKKIHVVHYGVEWKELQRPFDEGLHLREKILKQLGLDSGSYQFLFVGNEYERKGLGLLLKALARLPVKNFQLSVLGKERKPELFIQMAKELGLQERVRFLGPVKEVKVFYSAADCLVVPSLYDPFANVTVEALAMGLYVVSSSANGGSEVLTDEMGHVFEDLNHPEELASALTKAMEHPKTNKSAQLIRDSVSHLDFANQIGKIVRLTMDQ